MRRRGLSFQLLTPTLILGLTFCLLIAAFLIYWPASMDRASRKREEALVANGFVARVAELEGLITPNADWDDAVAMDQVTRQNTAMVQNSAAISESLTGDAVRLTDLVDRFVLGPVTEMTASPYEKPSRGSTNWMPSRKLGRG